MKATTNITLNEAAAYRYDLHTIDSMHHSHVYCSKPLTYEQVREILQPPVNMAYNVTIIEKVLNPVTQKYDMTMYLKPKDYYGDKEYGVHIAGVYAGIVKLNKRKHYDHAELIEEVSTQLNIAELTFKHNISEDDTITIHDIDGKVISDPHLLTGYTFSCLDIKTFKYTIVDSKGRAIWTYYNNTLFDAMDIYEFVPDNITGVVSVVRYKLATLDTLSIEDDVYLAMDAAL